MTGAKLRLALAATAFFAWIGVLAWTVAGNGKLPVLSKAQLTAAQSLIVADVTLDGQGLPADAVTVTSTVRGKTVTGKVSISNLPQAIAAGSYKTPAAGPHLIPVVPVGDTLLAIAGLPPSPGMNVPQPPRPIIYPWTDEVKKQLAGLGIGP
jgi:hypothetical protein